MKNMDVIKKDVIKKFREKYKLVSPYLNEKSRRIWAATEARIYGYGGITILSAATGIAKIGR